jgi:uncharacterized protein (TIGR00251 family)
LGSEARILLRVSPNAPKSEVVGFSEGILRVKIAAPPIKGKANRELVAFLSRLLGVSQSSLSIVRGHTSRTKTLSVSGLSQQELLGQLQSDDC